MAMTGYAIYNHIAEKTSLIKEFESAIEILNDGKHASAVYNLNVRLENLKSELSNFAIKKYIEQEENNENV